MHRPVLTSPWLSLCLSGILHIHVFVVVKDAFNKKRNNFRTRICEALEILLQSSIKTVDLKTSGAIQPSSPGIPM